MPRVEAPEKYLRETSNAGFRGPKKPKRMAEHRSHENRPVDGRAKNYRSEALGTGSDSGFSTASLIAMSIEIEQSNEDTAFIKRKKASVSKKYGPTRSKSIEEANELAVYLFALGRLEEAEVLLKSFSEKSPFVHPRYERWEAACYAMLLQAHIMKLVGNEREFERLVGKSCNDQFNPNHWFKNDDFDEFTDSVRAGVDVFDGVTKSEKLSARAEGILALLNAIYIWPNKFESFKARKSELEQLLTEEIDRLAELLS